MQFSDTATLTGLIQDSEQRLFGDHGYGQISGNATRLKHFTNLLNRALDYYASLAMMNDSRWQFDDANFDEFPVGNTAVTAGRQDYRFAVEQMIIVSVEILNRAGDAYMPLRELDEQDFLDRGITLSEFMSNANGPPVYYNKVADALLLYPAPDYTDSGGVQSLRVRFQRPLDYFVYTDSTKKPGFNATHHPFVSLYASWMYAKAHSLKQKKDLAEEVEKWETVKIPDFYANRSKDLKTKIVPAYRNSR